MRRTILSILTIALLACANGSSEQASRSTPDSTPASEEHGGHEAPPPAASPAGPAVSLEGGGSGYLAVPSSANGGAVIVIQEWWGVDDWVREQADRFAKQGYVALAVDLYRGRTAASAEEAHELMRGLPEDRAIADLKAGFNYLAGRPDVDPKRIAAVGWCMGGGYALALASAEPRLAASVINYGRLISDANTVRSIQPAILGNFGSADRGIPVDDVKRFDAALDAAGRQSDFKIYEGAGHAFMNPNNKDGYDAAASADAWKRIDEFFAAKIGGSSQG
jgi:carboxymethylenebutenolidase